MHLDTGMVVDRYTVKALLGEGGQAQVYLVEHRDLGTLHALKMMSALGQSLRERLLQEGRIQAHLRHPNIVTVTDVVTSGAATGLVMEYIRGPSLGQLLAHRTLCIEEVDAIASALLAGVGAAHAENLIHRDLKPDNILLAVERGTVVPKVADFGLSKILGDNSGPGRTRTGGLMGTPPYMSPEQTKDGKHLTAQSDIWSVGIILYELLCRRTPFLGDGLYDVFAAIHQGDFPLPSALRVDTPRRMERAICAALAQKPEDRPKTCNDLRSLWSEERGDTAPVLVRPNGGSWVGAFIADVEQLAPASEKHTGPRPLANRIAAPPPPAAHTLEFPDTPQLPALAPPKAAPQRRSRRPVWAIGAGLFLAATMSLFLVLSAGSAFWWIQNTPSDTRASSVLMESNPLPEPTEPKPTETVATAPSPEPLADLSAAEAFVERAAPTPTPQPIATHTHPSGAAPVPAAPLLEATPPAPIVDPSPTVVVAAPTAAVVYEGPLLLRLRDALGNATPHGTVEPDLYRIEVDWGDGFVPAGRCGRVTAGAPVQITCDERMKSCACR